MCSSDLIILPLYSGSELSGYIGLGDIEKAGEWRSKDLALFHIFAEIIGRGLERKKSGEALAAEKELLSVTLRSIEDGVISTNFKGRITLINKVAEKFTGWKEKEAFGRPVGEVFQCINEKTGKRYANAVKNILEKAWVTGIHILTKSIRPLSLRPRPVVTVQCWPSCVRLMKKKLWKMDQ